MKPNEIILITRLIFFKAGLSDKKQTSDKTGIYHYSLIPEGSNPSNFVATVPVYLPYDLIGKRTCKIATGVNKYLLHSMRMAGK